MYRCFPFPPLWDIPFSPTAASALASNSIAILVIHREGIRERIKYTRRDSIVHGSSLKL